MTAENVPAISGKEKDSGGSDMRLGLLLTVIATVSLATEAIAAKMAYRGGATVLTALSVRYVVAAAAFWIGVWVWRVTWRLPRRQVLLILGLTVCGHVTTVLALFYAFSYIPAGLAILLLYLYPAVVTLLAAPVLGEALTWRKGVALVLAFGGAVVILGLPLDGIDGRGVMLAVAAAFLNAFFYVAGARLVRDVPVVVFNTYLVSFGAVIFIVLGLGTGTLSAVVTPPTWGWLIYLGLVATAIALGAMFKGISILGASRASIISAMEPAITAVLAFWMLGETLTPGQMAGGALILAGVLMQTRE